MKGLDKIKVLKWVVILIVLTGYLLNILIAAQNSLPKNEIVNEKSVFKQKTRA